MNRCVIYTRVSTDKQEEKDSLINQIKRCSSYAELRGFDIVRTLSDVEIGSKDDRPEYLILKDMIKKELFDVLVVWEFSRISRNAREFISITEELKKHNIDLVCIQQQIDTSTITGKAVANLIAVISELERDTTSMRVKDRMVQLIKSGRYVAHKPFGYRYNDKKLLEIVEDEAYIIRDIFKRYLKGESRHSIAVSYNLDFTKVDRWLKSPLYIGKIAYVGSGKNRLRNSYILYDGLHAPVVDEDTFYAVQALLKSRHRTRSNDNPHYVFTGLVYCSCGEKMFGMKQSRGGHYYYRCNAGRSFKVINEIEHKKSYKASWLEKEVLKKLKEKIKNDDIMYKKDTNTEDETLIRKNSIEKKIKDIENKINKAKELYYNSLISIEEYSKDTKNFQSELTMLSTSLQELDKNNKVEYDNKKIKELVLKKIETIEDDKIKFKKLAAIAIKKIQFKSDGTFDIEFNF